MKTSLVSCLIGILLAASAFANFYQVHPSSTGAPRFIFLANQLHQTSGNDTLNDVLPPGCGVNPGDQFLKWENTLQCYLPWCTFNGTAWVPNVSFNTGEAGFLVSAATTVIINGTLPADVCAQISPGLSFNGRTVPVITKPDDIFCGPFLNFDTMYRWLPSRQAWDSTVATYISPDAGGSGWDPPTTANVAVGEAAVFMRGGSPLAPGFSPNTGLHVYIWAGYPSGLNTPCCGQQMTYHVVVVNWTGPSVVGATLRLNLDPGLITTIPAYPSIPGFVASAGVNWFGWADVNQMKWTLPTLNALQWSTIRLTVNVSGCTAPAVTTVSSSATLTAGTYVDTATHSVKTLCSHDPNDKAVTPHGSDSSKHRPHLCRAIPKHWHRPGQPSGDP